MTLPAAYPELGDLSIEDWASEWLRSPKNATELGTELTRLRSCPDTYPTFPLREPLASRWHQQATKEGRSPSALLRYSAIEAERYWARTVPGPDGHIFWTGGWAFRRNDKYGQRPHRWAWEQAHGVTLGKYEDCVVMCGEPRCVNVGHLAIGRGIRRQRMTHEQIVGALQVLAMRLGRPPMMKEWDAAGLRITSDAVRLRLGGRTRAWAVVLERAGIRRAALPPSKETEQSAP